MGKITQSMALKGCLLRIGHTSRTLILAAVILATASDAFIPHRFLPVQYTFNDETFHSRSSRRSSWDLNTHKRNRIEEPTHKSYHEPNHSVNYLLKQCQSVAAATLTAGILFTCPPSWAQDESLEAPASTTSSPPTTKTTISSPSNVLEEVWSLADKYYIDKTYGHQNWNSVLTTYSSKLPSDGASDKNEQSMKLATTMINSLGDKYSRILDVDAYTRIQKFDLIGVGATLMPDSNKRIMVGAPPVAASEAERVGIKVGDYITAVNGVPTEGRTAFDIIDQIGEQPNSGTIDMTVLTQGSDDVQGEGYSREVTMKRAFAQVKNPVSYKMSEKRPDGTNVGYIRISEFNSLVKPKLEEALKSLKDQGSNAYVLDMRSNPGGAFQSAVEIASYFYEDGLATTVIDSNEVEIPFRTSKEKLLVQKDDPIVIWLDGGSASATEVLAGALHDQCRAAIMGSSHSFGKGLIQAVYGLSNGSGLVLTVAKYVTPNGTEIQGTGITPDIEAKLPLLLVPGISSDTSKIDFGDVTKRLGPSMCFAPKA